MQNAANLPTAKTPQPIWFLAKNQNMKMEQLRKICGMAMIFAAIHAAAIPVAVSYHASAPVGTAGQTNLVDTATANLVSLGPDGQPLYNVTFSSGQITITSLRTFTGPTYFQFDWTFDLAPATFSGATLLSSSLFSVPPFTFPVNPTVSLDSTGQNLAIHLFLTGGGNGTPTVNAGGSAVIAYTIPESSPTWILLAASVALISLGKFLRASACRK